MSSSKYAVYLKKNRKDDAMLNPSPLKLTIVQYFKHKNISSATRLLGFPVEIQNRMVLNTGYPMDSQYLEQYPLSILSEHGPSKKVTLSVLMCDI